MNKKIKTFLLILSILAALLYLGGPWVLTRMGQYLVVDDQEVRADAAVVLSTGVDYYPRLIQAADLYGAQRVKYIVINGNRKTDVLRELELRGYKSCCNWAENSLRILELLDVPRARVISISAEDVFDTISEARYVGERLHNYSSLMITTSRFHTGRAKTIWTTLYQDRFKIYASGAKMDPFTPNAWWHEGRQIRWVLAEYGGWIYFYLNQWFK